MNSLRNNSNNNIMWHKSNNNTSYDKTNNQILCNKSNNQTPYNGSNNQISYNRFHNQTPYNRFNNQILCNKSNNQTPYNRFNNQILCNKSNNQTPYNRSNNQILYNKSNNNKPTNKIVIAIVLGVFVLISCICAFRVKVTKKVNKGNSIEDSNKMVNNYSDTDDTWIVDDQPEDNISNSDMVSAENKFGVANSEEAIMEDTTEEKIITGSASQETEQPIATSKPTETSRPIVTTSPTEITTPVSTPSPTAAPIVTPQPTVAPIVTPQPIATPQPVITEYASLVTPYTRKDSNGQIVYILDNSENRYYSVSELQSLTNEQLRFARNEVFARRGGKFNSSDLHQYFSSRSWYAPIRMAEDFEDEDLNAYEIANIKLIQSVEKSRIN